MHPVYIKFNLLSSIVGINLDDPINGFLFHHEEIIIKKDSSFLENHFFTPKFSFQAGDLAKYTISKQPYFYKFYDHLVTDQEFNLFQNHEYFHKYIANLTEVFSKKTQVLIGILWIIKDNCVNLSGTYIHLPELEDTKIRRRTPLLSTSEGLLNETTYFSNEELNLAYEYVLKLTRISENEHREYSPDEIDINGTQLSSYSLHNYNTNNRIDRAWLFLGSARSHSYLPSKISFYVALFESLFTSSGSGIMHEVADRVSRYFTNDDKERKAAYGLIGEAYKLRSNFFHGNRLQNGADLNDMKKLSKKLDDITRVIFRKALDIDSQSFTNNRTKAEMKQFYNSF